MPVQLHVPGFPFRFLVLERSMGLGWALRRVSWWVRFIIGGES